MCIQIKNVSHMNNIFFQFSTVVVFSTELLDSLNSFKTATLLHVQQVLAGILNQA